jgi:2-oxoglutarate ferredoxin oxidoreductase subunit alpha
MTELRHERIAGISATTDLTEVDDVTGDASVCLVGWGSTYGALNAGVERIRARGLKAAHVHLVTINPLPRDLGEVLGRYDKILVPELNLGQLVKVLRSEFLVDAKGLSKVRGLPFKAAEIEAAVLEQLEVN